MVVVVTPQDAGWPTARSEPAEVAGGACRLAAPILEATKLPVPIRRQAVGGGHGRRLPRNLWRRRRSSRTPCSSPKSAAPAGHPPLRRLLRHRGWWSAMSSASPLPRARGSRVDVEQRSSANFLAPRFYVLDYFLFRFFTGLPRYPIHDDFYNYDFIYLFVLQVLHSTVQFTLQRTATYIRDFTNLSSFLLIFLS